MTPAQKEIPTLIHIAGYHQDSDGFHPEFHFVRNAESIDAVTGDYVGLTDAFRTNEKNFGQKAASIKSRQPVFLTIRINMRSTQTACLALAVRDAWVSKLILRHF